MKFPLPDRVIRLIDKVDRKKLGLKTREEAIAAAEIKSERDLHKQIENLLRLRGIEFFSSRTDKRTTRPVGEPDILFCVIHKPIPDETTGSRLSWPVACAWELKLPGRRLDPEQAKMFVRMSASPNGWRVQVISSVDEALAQLRELGL